MYLADARQKCAIASLSTVETDHDLTLAVTSIHSKDYSPAIPLQRLLEDNFSGHLVP